MLIAVVLGAETSQERFSACKSMLDYGFANFALVDNKPEAVTVPVKLGQNQVVAAIPGGDTRLLIDKQQRNEISLEVSLEETVTAPVSKGQKLGTLTVKAGDRILMRIPMVARDAVQRKTWGQIFLDVLKYMVMGG
jgi:D-alanyl-D-alanine carboxypeptidase (penicillin-binding protein 5/6)